MGSSNHHIYHSDDGRCITCGLDKRTGANVLCITAVEDDRSTVAGEESSNYPPGGGVSRPSPSSPVVGEGFEDTPDYDDSEEGRFQKGKWEDSEQYRAGEDW
jgi:hypothetical protein